MFWMQTLREKENLQEPGEDEEIRLSENDYDASRSSLGIQLYTQDENDEERWEKYRNQSLKRVG